MQTFSLDEPETATEFRNIAGIVDIIGLNPETDAIRQDIAGGVRIWYYHNDEIRYVVVTNNQRRIWKSESVVTVEEMKESIQKSNKEDVKIIDSRTFNWLSTKIGTVVGVHDGIMWGIVVHCQRQIKNGTNPSSQSLQSVAGIGTVLGDSIESKLEGHEYPN